MSISSDAQAPARWWDRNLAARVAAPARQAAGLRRSAENRVARHRDGTRADPYREILAPRGIAALPADHYRFVGDDRPAGA
jgi:hypothetical protein